MGYSENVLLNPWN